LTSATTGAVHQFYSVEISPKTWERELAHARTFCFFEEIEFLIKNGLIKGGSLENAVWCGTTRPHHGAAAFGR